MEIKDILELPTNTSVLGTFTVTKVKKSFLDIIGEYVCRVVLTDKTGDMLADFHTIVYSPLQNGMQVELYQAMTQYAEDGKKLYVESWNEAGEPISEPPEPMPHDERIIRSKIKCRLTEAFICRYGTGNDEDGWSAEKFLKSDYCKDLIGEILK